MEPPTLRLSVLCCNSSTSAIDCSSEALRVPHWHCLLGPMLLLGTRSIGVCGRTDFCSSASSARIAASRTAASIGDWECVCSRLLLLLVMWLLLESLCECEVCRRRLLITKCLPTGSAVPNWRARKLEYLQMTMYTMITTAITTTAATTAAIEHKADTVVLSSVTPVTAAELALDAGALAVTVTSRVALVVHRDQIDAVETYSKQRSKRMRIRAFIWMLST